MTASAIGDLIGGIGLFLLGMQLMTNGLKEASGEALRSALDSATRSRLRGLLSGVVITALVQSSSAVTVATIGFVNAGLINLGQSIAVIYGSNIGTTLTIWLIALVGFKIKITAFALPMIGLGMLLKLAGGERRIASVGMALAGFGTFFIGLDFLKGSFENSAELIDMSSIAVGTFTLLLFALGGFVLTFVMMSSAASMAIALSLTASGALPLAPAAAIVIGANVGTTGTALLATLGATSNAKRLASAHILFNLITGAVGLLMLMLIAGWLNGLDPRQLDMVSVLALFHSLFNITGVLMLWPFTERLVTFLKGRFRTQEEDAQQPRFLDKNALANPALAFEAMARELIRVDHMSTVMARESLSSEAAQSIALNRQYAVISRLIRKITKFNQKAAQLELRPEMSRILPMTVRIARHINESSRLASVLPSYSNSLNRISDPRIQEKVLALHTLSIRLIDATEIQNNGCCQRQNSGQLWRQFEKDYARLKSDILSASTEHRLKARESVELLDALSHMHRMMSEHAKICRYWSRFFSRLDIRMPEEEPAKDNQGRALSHASAREAS